MKKKTAKRRIRQEIDLEQILIQSRQVFLFGDVCAETVLNAKAQLIALQEINKKPIILWINSGGGSVPDGWSLVSTIRLSSAPIITIIDGQACSMAGIISLAGHKKYITTESWWMSHDLSSCSMGKATNLIANAEQLKLEQDNLFKYIQSKTKLSPEEIQKALHSELWLNAQQCLEKGIVDDIL